MNHVYVVTRFGCDSGVGNLYAPKVHVFSHEEDARALFESLAYEVRSVGKSALVCNQYNLVIQRGEEYDGGASCPCGVRFECLPVKTMVEEDRLALTTDTKRKKQQVRCDCGELYHPDEKEKHLTNKNHMFYVQFFQQRKE